MAHSIHNSVIKSRLLDTSLLTVYLIFTNQPTANIDTSEHTRFRFVLTPFQFFWLRVVIKLTYGSFQASLSYRIVQILSINMLSGR